MHTIPTTIIAPSPKLNKMQVFKLLDKLPTPQSDDEILEFRLDGSTIKTEDDFFKAIASSLSFPDYFGENLDALYDCLNDLDWIGQTTIIIQFDNYDDLLSQAQKTFKEDVFSICYETAFCWAEGQNGEMKDISFLVKNTEIAAAEFVLWGFE